MVLQETTVGLLGLLAIAACWALAVVLYRAGSTGSVARKLSLLLFIEGFTLVTGNYPEMFFLGDPSAFYELHPLILKNVIIAHTIGDFAMLALYPAFLAVALPTKLTSFFASSRMRIGMAVIAALLFLAVQLSSVEIGLTILYLGLSVLFGYALVASVHAWRVAPAGIARSRARLFALAFGFRDLCWGFVYAYAIWQLWTGSYFWVEPSQADLILGIIYALGTLLAVPIIAYGILQTQLFDIDLKIRWTIKQSTLAGIFVAIMFVISEGAAQFLEAELGNIAGLLAAAVVMFFLAPLQRFSERVASAAMPNTQNTPEYAAFRKMQVYESALSEALMEGGISDKERTLLVHLRDSLGISESDAQAIEGELQAI